MAEKWTKVECLCGTTAAIPESGLYPTCSRCGRRMVAPDLPDREVFDGPSGERHLSDEVVANELILRDFSIWPRDVVLG